MCVGTATPRAAPRATCG